MTTKYQCYNNHTFTHPAKLTYHQYSEVKKVEDNTKSGSINFTEITPLILATEEYAVCPECGTTSFKEVVDPQPKHVHIYDLTSGAQSELDKLLAEGYQVVARYSKQYHLEKPKETKP